MDKVEDLPKENYTFEIPELFELVDNIIEENAIDTYLLISNYILNGIELKEKKDPFWTLKSTNYSSIHLEISIPPPELI